MSEAREGAGGGPPSRRPRPRWYLHRTVLFLAALIAAWTGWSGYDALTAPRKIDPALLPALASGRSVNIWVELPFPPEEFHIRYLQDRGTVSGVQGHWIHLIRVRPAMAWSIARLYWVERLQSEPGPQGAGRARERVQVYAARRQGHRPARSVPPNRRIHGTGPLGS